MLFVPNGANDFSGVVSYGTTRPGTTTPFGTTITPATGAAYSAFTKVGSNLTQDCYGIYVNINAAFTAVTFRQLAIQIGVDYAGGTTFSQIIVDGLVGSQASTYNLGGGMWYYFPIYIPAGSGVGVSARSSLATTFGVFIKYMTAPVNPTLIKRASFTETLGLTLGTGTVAGVAVTPGTTAEGAWTAIGTTTKRTWWWQYACQHSDTTMTALNYHLDIGVGSATTPDIILLDSYQQTTANESFNNIPNIIGVEKVVPGGTTIYARIQNAGTNENGGTFQIVAYGCGG